MTNHDPYGPVTIPGMRSQGLAEPGRVSARPMTKSAAKLQNWADTRELDRRAKELAERERIPLIEALEKAIERDR